VEFKPVIQVFAGKIDHVRLRNMAANRQPDRERVMLILEQLAALYPNARCELIHADPFELFIAVILSAQSTDQRVNMVTERLFRVFKTPQDFAQLHPSELEPYIQELGLFRNKARHIIAAAQRIITEFNGEVPQERAALESMPGVGRKTANVILTVAFGVPAIAVDTHVFRVAHRLGLASDRTPEQTEATLRRLIPKELWSQTHHWLIFHGRRMCSAKKPACERCPLLVHCPAGPTYLSTKK
jgi:endonuclease-3